jgi:membrane-associated phospholipid phosphatase
MYSEEAPLDARTDANGALSFFSGHTTTAFAAAVVLNRTLARRHPQSSAQWIALGTTLGAASLVGVSRIVSGNHFPTDVMAGALVGSSVGVLVPALHRSGLTLTPVSSTNTLGLSFGGVW